ncbi:deubiquitinase OTUD6B-like [Eurosta solidaginis]|uniref:deubiquitinase OTUD6B-like n=1 Tax=Eurosta solidaginis TaxID=178769 RepID=UPI003530F474
MNAASKDAAGIIAGMSAVNKGALVLGSVEPPVVGVNLNGLKPMKTKQRISEKECEGSFKPESTTVVKCGNDTDYAKQIRPAQALRSGSLTKQQSVKERHRVMRIKAEEDISNDENEEHNGLPKQRISKAQKRRDKKAREARQREEEILAAAEDAKFAPKATELRAIQTKLLERQLTLHNIPSDGDCLYNAVRHQLSQHGLANHSVQKLRNESANYIRTHKDTLICYMTNPKTGDLLTDDEFNKYCETLRTTPAWGGQIELKALSSILKVPIEVLQAEGPSTVQGADEFAGPNLLITYHRHMYSLGEHYNSTLPIDKTVGESGGSENE